MRKEINKGGSPQQHETRDAIESGGSCRGAAKQFALFAKTKTTPAPEPQNRRRQLRQNSPSSFFSSVTPIFGRNSGKTQRALQAKQRQQPKHQNAISQQPTNGPETPAPVERYPPPDALPPPRGGCSWSCCKR